MSKESRHACPKCHTKIAWLKRSRFIKYGFVPTVAPCPHCEVELTYPAAPLKKMWIGVLIFAVPGWIEHFTVGEQHYSYFVLPLALWLIWSNAMYFRLILATPQDGPEDSEQS